MNRVAAVSLLAAVIVVGACATEAPTGPAVAAQAMIGQGVSLSKGPSTCPKPTPRPTRPVQLQGLSLSPLPLSIVGVTQVNVLFTNATCETLEMVWVRPTGALVSYGQLQPGETNQQDSYVGHVWLIRRADQTPYAVFRIEDQPSGSQEVYLGCAKGRYPACN
jgi:hypothetical protein